jgi:hypothetical protein
MRVANIADGNKRVNARYLWKEFFSKIRREMLVSGKAGTLDVYLTYAPR